MRKFSVGFHLPSLTSSQTSVGWWDTGEQRVVAVTERTCFQIGRNPVATAHHVTRTVPVGEFDASEVETDLAAHLDALLRKYLRTTNRLGLK